MSYPPPRSIILSLTGPNLRHWQKSRWGRKTPDRFTLQGGRASILIYMFFARIKVTACWYQQVCVCVCVEGRLTLELIMSPSQYHRTPETKISRFLALPSWSLTGRQKHKQRYFTASAPSLPLFYSNAFFFFVQCH